MNDLKAPSSTGSLFVGLTDVKYAGKIIGPTTQAVGINGAVEACVGKFGKGAHMYPFELYGSAAAVLPAFTKDTTMPQAWVYMIGWNRNLGVSGVPSAQAEDDYAGLGENCGSFTQGDLDEGLGWNGRGLV